MALSPSAASALKLATMWVALAGFGTLAVANLDLVREVLGINFEAGEASSPDTPRDPPRESDTPSESDEADAPRGSGGRTVELKAGPHGHFYSRIRINGRFVEAIVDTGASVVALTYEDAESAGIHVREPEFTHRVSTANGIARVAIVTLDSVSIDDITVRNVSAAVAERGKLSRTLLGMSFLGKLSRTEMTRGVLVLEE